MFGLIFLALLIFGVVKLAGYVKNNPAVSLQAAKLIKDTLRR